MPAEHAGWIDFGPAYRYETVELGTDPAFSVDVLPGNYLVAATDLRPSLVSERLEELAAGASLVTVVEGQTASVTTQLKALRR